MNDNYNDNYKQKNQGYRNNYYNNNYYNNKTNYEDSNNDYYGYDDYYTQAVNTKNDAGSTTISSKQTRIPLYKVKEDTEIPPMPEKIDKPNDSHYEKLIAEVETQITKHKKSIEEINVKIENERYGNNPERTNLTEQRRKLVESIKPINEQLFKLQEELYPVRGDIDYYKGEKEALAKEIDYKDLNRLNNEIRYVLS